MLESKAASGKDDINRTKYRFNRDLISTPHILTKQQSKPAKLCHAESTEILPETCVPLSLPHGKALALKS